MSRDLLELHRALIDLAGFLNQPQRDSTLLQEAGVQLDRALFPLLVVIERKGAIGVVEVANLVGRDYTTVSRQIAKLESLRLIARISPKADKRVRQAKVTPKGLRTIERLQTARERMAKRLLPDWTPQDIRQLTRLLRRFVDDVSKVGDSAQSD